MLSMLLALLLLPSPMRGQTQPVAMGRSDAEVHTLAEQYLFRSVNAERALAGLPSLQWNPVLGAAARSHAERMQSTLTLSHQLVGESDLTVRAASSGAAFSRVAENVAVGHSILKMHDALMHSPHHRENILDPALNSIAIAVVGVDGSLWAVEDFARDVEKLSFADQEERARLLLEQAGIASAATDDARATCRMTSGFVGQRPGFVMRYTTGDLNAMPGELKTRLASGRYRMAAVGACAAEDTGGFSSYNIVVLLYR